MSKLKYDEALVQLVKSLSKSEKRYFKIYSHRNSTKEKSFNFIALFNIIEKSKRLDSIKIQKLIPEISPKKLSDLKRHLYNQLLECLRIYNSNNEGFKLKAQIEKARVLYDKGLYFQSLSVLKKTKHEALKNEKHLVAYEIIDFEKEIESRHITRSHSSRSHELEIETNTIREIIRSEADWSEFSLKLYAKFIEKGHVKSKSDLEEITNYFNLQKPKTKVVPSKFFFESVYYHQAHGWFNFIIQNFVTGYRHSRAWVQLFEKYPTFKNTHPHLYIKGLHNCLSVLYNCMDNQRHQRYLDELENFTQSCPNLNKNARLMAFIHTNNAQLNWIILSGEFSKSKSFLVKFEEDLSLLDIKIDDYRHMVFLYRMASVYFTMGDYLNCIRLLNKIINPNQQKLREDLQCFARLLNIIAHFELGNDELLTYLIKSTYRFLLKMNEVMKLQETIINFLKISLFKERNNLKEAFVKLKIELERVNEDPYEKRSFLYLDIISWLESKIENKSVESIIYNKRVTLNTAVKW